jgi:hypothetical protein
MSARDPSRTRLWPHTHPDNTSTVWHNHGGHYPEHCHIDDGPAGRTLVEAGWTEDMPKWPERHPDLARDAEPEDMP